MSNTSLPASGPGRPKDPAKRQAILEAAKTLFLRHGYASISMDAIAAEAGVSKLTVYSHFNDKETLFSAAVQARCEEQLPEYLFELPEGAPIERVLEAIGLNFCELINSHESIELHRVMVTLATQDAALSRMFYEAGPQRVLVEMERLLRKADARGQLRLGNPQTAAEHFLCLLKGVANFRLLVGCGEAPQGEAAEQHVREVVALFVRAFQVSERA